MTKRKNTDNSPIFVILHTANRYKLFKSYTMVTNYKSNKKDKTQSIIKTVFYFQYKINTMLVTSAVWGQQWPHSKLLNNHLNAKERKDRK